MQQKWLFGIVTLVLGGSILIGYTSSRAPEPAQSAPSVSMSSVADADNSAPEPEPKPEPAAFVWHRPSAPSVPTPSAESFGKLEEPFEAYLDQWGIRIDPETGRAEQDMQLRDAMQAKAEAMSALSERYRELADAGDESWSRHAEVRLGDLQEEMAAWLELLPYPSYLNEDQYAVYDQAIQAMAVDHRTAAAEAYEAALTDLPEDDPLHTVLTDRLADVDG